MRIFTIVLVVGCWMLLHGPANDPSVSGVMGGTVFCNVGYVKATGNCTGGIGCELLDLSDWEAWPAESGLANHEHSTHELACPDFNQGVGDTPCAGTAIQDVLLIPPNPNNPLSFACVPN